MELEEENTLRKQIREILLNTEDLKDIKSLTQKKALPELKKDCYTKLVDLKNEFESEKENTDKEGTIKQIEDLIASLNQLKKAFSNQLD